MWGWVLWAAVVYVTIRYLQKKTRRINSTADKKLEDFRDSVTLFHEERVSFWLQELDSARLPEYRDYCQQQVDYWHWNTPRVRADVEQRWAQLQATK